MHKVVINEQAFVAMVAAAIEVYEKETYGLLLGTFNKKEYHVKNAIVYQTSTRKVSEVSIWPVREEKVIDAINFLTGYSLLGDFHSHGDYPKYLSDYDKEDMKDSGERLTMLLIVEKSKRVRKWKHDKKDKSVHGSINGRYYVTLKAYEYDAHKNKIQKLPIICKYMKKLNEIIVKKFL